MRLGACCLSPTWPAVEGARRDERGSPGGRGGLRVSCRRLYSCPSSHRCIFVDAVHALDDDPVGRGGWFVLEGANRRRRESTLFLKRSTRFAGGNLLTTLHRTSRARVTHSWLDRRPDVTERPKTVLGAARRTAALTVLAAVPVFSAASTTTASSTLDDPVAVAPAVPAALPLCFTGIGTVVCAGVAAGAVACYFFCDDIMGGIMDMTGHR